MGITIDFFHKLGTTPSSNEHWKIMLNGCASVSAQLIKQWSGCHQDPLLNLGRICDPSALGNVLDTKECHKKKQTQRRKLDTHSFPVDLSRNLLGVLQGQQLSGQIS